MHFKKGRSQTAISKTVHRAFAAAGVGVLIATLAVAVESRGADLRSTPLFDGERTALHTGAVINYWGGAFSPGSTAGITLQGDVVHSGDGAYRIDLAPTAPGQFGFFQTFSSELKGQLQRSTRDLTSFEMFETYVRNDTGAPFDLVLEIKDYRDSNSQRAQRTFAIPAGGWTKVSTPLSLTSGWSVSGTPQLDRTYALSFLVKPTVATLSGPIYFDDARLIEPGGPLDPLTAPIGEVAEALARRTFLGMWGARNRETSLVPNVSTDADAGALNTTSGVVWALPSAVRRGWVSASDADAYMSKLADSLNANLDQTTYLPTRFLGLSTGGPLGGGEESPVDAAFLALGLHQYKSQPGVDASLASKLDAVENRFDFSALASSNGWRLNYVPGSGLSGGTYSGYTTEGKVISLAAALSDSHPVALSQLWNSDTYRTVASLVD
ncbi:MAG: hypothetical protein KDA61_19035, partial [Planctomycetales bacterium]|nr:hypothetical protein [Planctomycetales bacterium]